MTTPTQVDATAVAVQPRTEQVTALVVVGRVLGVAHCPTVVWQLVIRGASTIGGSYL